MNRRVLTSAVVTAGLLALTVCVPIGTAAAAPMPSPGTAGAAPAGASMAERAAEDPASVLSSLSATTGSGTWTPAPQQSFDLAAGVACDAPVHVEGIVDNVVQMTLSTWPDGSSHRVAYVGGLLTRVTNTATGVFAEVDASGSAIVDYFPDSSMTWYAFGPIVATFRAGQGNLPRGLYQINGLYRLVFTPTLHRTLTMAFGTTDNICDRL